MLELVWSCGPGLSNSLFYLLDTCDLEEEAEEKEENDEEFAFDDFSESDGE